MNCKLAAAALIVTDLGWVACSPGAKALNLSLQDEAVIRDWDAQKLYDYGFGFLKRGRLLQRAAASLKLAVEKDPASLDYRLALASAYAGRFASVALALRQAAIYESEMSRYDAEHGQWEEAQNNPSHPFFGKPEPGLPARPITVDDGKLYARTREESKQTLVELGRQCIQAFEETHRLAERLKPDQKGRAEYLRGWGLFSLWRFGREVVRERPAGENRGQSPPIPLDDSRFLYLSESDIVECFRNACKIEPANVNYMHSLALSLVPHYVDPTRDSVFAKYDEGGIIHKVAEIDESIEWMKKAIERKPSNAQLHFQAGLIAAAKTPADSIPYLEKATRILGINSALWYLLAYQHIRIAHRTVDRLSDVQWQKALDAVASGNHAPQYWAIPFSLPVPPELTKVWGFVPAYGFGEDALVLMNLGVSISDRVRAKIQQNDEKSVMRAIPLLMGMGLRAIGGFGAGDLEPLDNRGSLLNATRLKWGVIHCGEAYALMKKTQAARPSALKADLVARYAELNERFIRPLSDYVLAVR